MIYRLREDARAKLPNDNEAHSLCYCSEIVDSRFIRGSSQPTLRWGESKGTAFVFIRRQSTRNSKDIFPFESSWHVVLPNKLISYKQNKTTTTKVWFAFFFLYFFLFSHLQRGVGTKTSLDFIHQVLKGNISFVTFRRNGCNLIIQNT